MSTKLYQRVVHKNIFVVVCPLNYIGGLTNKFGNRRLFNELLKTKIFCFGNSFFIDGKCKCEGVGEDLGHGGWHVDIRVGMCMIVLECVCVCHCMCT